jgi:hypothetical protein
VEGRRVRVSEGLWISEERECGGNEALSVLHAKIVYSGMQGAQDAKNEGQRSE